MVVESEEITLGLKTYEQHIKEKKDKWFQRHYESKNKPSGITCPKCGAELLYDSTMVLLSIPPQYKAWCPNGDWEGNI